MRNFLADWKKTIDKELDGKSEENIAIKESKIDQSKLEPKTIDCDIFNGETIAISYGRASLKPNLDGPGGRIHLKNTGKKVQFDGVIFSYKELQILFEQEHDQEMYQSVYNAKKTFGSTSKVIQNNKDLEEIWKNK